MRTRLLQLDGLRGVAAVAVMLYHLVWRTHPELLDTGEGFWLGAYQQLGRDGVFLFFVLSGFLVGGRAVDALLLDRPSRATGPFLLARAARILPLWWFVLGIVLLVAPAPDVHGVFDVLKLAALQHHLDPQLLRDVVKPAWTLCVEVWFYAVVAGLLAVAPSMRRRLPRWSRWWLVASSLLGVVAWSAWQRAQRLGDSYWNSHDTAWQSWSLFAFSDMFALGMLVAVLYRTPLRGSDWLGAALPLLATATYVVTIAGRESLDGYGPALMGLACAMLVGGVVLPSRAPLERLLAHRAACELGTLSYGIYLWHMPVALAFRELGLLAPTQSWLVAAAMVGGVAAVTICLARITWVFVEAPAISAARAGIAPLAVWAGMRIGPRPRPVR